MKTKPKVTKASFLDFYFSDRADVLHIGHRVVETLKIGGTYTVDVEYLFKECGYIPAHILINYEEFQEDDEFEPSEVELLD